MSAHCEKHGCNLVYTEYPFMECPLCYSEREGRGQHRAYPSRPLSGLEV